MPNTENGRITLAKLSQQVTTIAEDIGEMRRQGERREEMWLTDHNLLLDLCGRIDATNARIDAIAMRMDDVRSARRESRIIDTLLALASAYLAIKSFGP